MLIHGYEFEFSSLNANDIDRLDAANARYQKVAAAALHDQLSYADSLRSQCHAVMDFLDEVFGAGAAEKLGLDGNDYGKAIAALTEVQAAIAAEKQSLQETVTAPQNREQRRSKKHRKHPAPVSFPAQTSTAVAAVKRVDKQTRRKQLLRELAALEND